MVTSLFGKPQLIFRRMVDVFKTNITDAATAENVQQQLQRKWPKAEINFDLDDCDHILRIDHHCDVRKFVINRLADWGYYCDELE
jgi:hypothetical protein